MTKPTALLKLEKGKLYHTQRGRAANEPQATQEIRPRCPRTFTPAERKVWRAYAAILESYGLLQGGNTGLLRRLSTAAVLYEKLRESYIDTELPKVGIEMMRVGRDMDAMETALGLPSIARAKIGSLIFKAKQQKDAFFD